MQKNGKRVFDLVDYTIASEYYQRKYLWTKEIFNSIDWESVLKSTKIPTPSIQVWITKTVTEKLLVAKNMAPRENWTSSKCSCCGCPEEDVELNVKVRNLSNSSLQKEMNSKIFLESWIWKNHTGDYLFQKRKFYPQP